MNILQIILISAFAFWTIVDALSFNMAFSKPVVSGLIVGAILGDPITGLVIGGTLQLLILGVGTYGGASIPDYNTSAMIGTIAAIVSGLPQEAAVALAVPLGLLLIQLDVLARFSNTYFMHRADAKALKADIKGVARMNILGMIPWGLSRGIPVLLFCIWGDVIVQPLTEFTESAQWLTAAFKVAAGMLPAVGFAILLRYVNAKKYIAWVLIGFSLSAFLATPIVFISILGAAAAIITYKGKAEATAVAGGTQDE